MNYLDAYRNRGGRVPEKAYSALRERLLNFSLSRSGASVGGLSPSAREAIQSLCHPHMDVTSWW